MKKYTKIIADERMVVITTDLCLNLNRSSLNPSKSKLELGNKQKYLKQVVINCHDLI